MNKLTLDFPTPEDAKAFAEWLCGQGEQDYWQWMEEQDAPLLTNIDYRNGAGNSAKFLHDNTIKFTETA